jgi:hypothetical protein
MYMGVEITLNSKNPNKKLKLGKKVLYRLRTILINTLAEFEQQQDIIKRHLARQTQVYEHKQTVSYITLQLDMDRAKFILENGRDLFRHPKHDDAIKMQHQRSLKKNLDLIILNVIYETMTGEVLTTDAIVNAKYGDMHASGGHVPLNTPEGLMKLYHMNRGLVKYLREELIVSLHPYFKKNRDGMQKGGFKEIIKKKIGHLIESYYIKYPDTHQNVNPINFSLFCQIIDFKIEQTYITDQSANNMTTNNFKSNLIHSLT